MNTLEAEFLSPAFLQNPYPWYEALRSTAPLAYHPQHASWFATDFEDVNTILRDRRFGRKTPPGAGKRVNPPDAFQQLGDHTLMDMEPPDHTRLKGLVMSIFTPRRVETLRVKVQDMALHLGQAARESGSFDLLTQVAEPLSVTVIADLLGVPDEIRPHLRPWSKDIVAMYELAPASGARARANTAVEEFSRAFTDLMEARRAHPADDLVSGLAAAVTAGQISDQEAVAAGILLLNAGHEATVNASGNGLLALLNMPGQWQMLRGNPALVRGAVEEMLRYDTPLQLFHRWVMEDVEYKGITFRAGERIALLYGAANRDPKKFDRPEQFDITRAENGHITFGSGIHYCLGAPLARLELTVTLQMLLDLFPNIAVEGQPEFMPSFVIRGLKELRLRCA